MLHLYNKNIVICHSYLYFYVFLIQFNLQKNWLYLYLVVNLFNESNFHLTFCLSNQKCKKYILMKQNDIY
jgi:hypothetical protein